jgi:hypothetical protein
VIKRKTTNQGKKSSQANLSGIVTLLLRAEISQDQLRSTLKAPSRMEPKIRPITLVQGEISRMKLSDARDAMYLNTGTVSELCRKLSYSGLAIVWIVRTNDDLSASFEKWWIAILIGYIIALACDLLQYFVLGLVWGTFNDEKHKSGETLGSDITPPSKINSWGFRFYYVKFSIVVLTTLLLLVALSKIILA